MYLVICTGGLFEYDLSILQHKIDRPNTSIINVPLNILKTLFFISLVNDYNYFHCKAVVAVSVSRT